MNIFLIFSFISSICLTNFAILKLTPWMKGAFLDIPNSRSSHIKTKPKSGGLFFIFFILLTNLFVNFIYGLNTLSVAIYLATLISIIGLIDDLILLPANIRYVFQYIFSTLLVFISSEFFFTFSNFKIILFLSFTGTAIINLFNFMDGIDGLLIGCSIVVIVFSLLNTFDFQILILLGSLIAFTKWNWEPSKIFMGDCGSYFLGSLTFFLILRDENSYLDYKILCIIAPLIMDTSSCLIRRLLNKENIFKAHSKHLYQRLYKGGLSHSKVSLIYIGSTLVNATLIHFAQTNILICFLFLELICGIYLDKFKAEKFC